MWTDCHLQMDSVTDAGTTRGPGISPVPRARRTRRTRCAAGLLVWFPQVGGQAEGSMGPATRLGGAPRKEQQASRATGHTARHLPGLGVLVAADASMTEDALPPRPLRGRSAEARHPAASGRGRRSVRTQRRDAAEALPHRSTGQPHHRPRPRSHRHRPRRIMGPDLLVPRGGHPDTEICR